MEHIHTEDQMRLFARPTEKGSAEWGAFHAVREDLAGSYRILPPEKKARYSNVTVIRRYQPRAQSLFLKGAR